ncbi:hypothetical protein TPHA_0B03470 [Tetrapisispora phaffii CBS 4417]|uniref:SPX domain-containing protein n=1 Tax=Tetrapisispora phaffii (strain ATCC 24235 / CBS 4417 / NBRC 1672 / NRRL Y-8282 / UCD 70-5) TaxID=1071381 RepID=G8BPT6_TETPH|nr:hypothetical protein TPHA_0B03470 [Tetrapisispora phaffii CBS 4417]CCE62017.1 hypothetical protein TPHA_0B03470 [Tetrapisispora phaffii CBS 4417]
MKFASLILDKSVPEWKYNNIDYTKLKIAIKKATTPNGNENHYLDNLSKLFKEQIKNVNIFTSLKIKELSNRIVLLESSILNCKRRNSSSLSSKKRAFQLINLHLNDCKSELQKLSRYIIVQRIAIRKLFKKIIKHSQHDVLQTKAYLETIKCSPEFKYGYEGTSFITLDLDSYLLEISLIQDVLFEAFSEYKKEKANKRSKKNSNLIHENVHLKSLDFDTIFLGRSTKVQSFLISFENIEEFKFLILKSGFNLVDDNIAETSKVVIKNSASLSPKNSARSVRSFQDLTTPTKNSIAPLGQQLQPLKTIVSTSPQESPFGNSNPQSSPTNTISNKNSRASSFTVDARSSQSHEEYFFLKAEKNEYTFLTSKSSNQYPDILLKSGSENREDSNILLCSVGGLRGHIVTNTISQAYVNLLKHRDNTTTVNNIDFDGLDSISKMAVKWITSHKLGLKEPGYSFKRTRFLKYTKNAIYYLSIDQNFVIDNEEILHNFVEIRKVPHIENNENNTSSSLVSDLTRVAHINNDIVIGKICKSMITNKVQAFPIDYEDTIWRIIHYLSNKRNKCSELFTFLLKQIYDVEENSALNCEEFFEVGKQLISEMVPRETQKEEVPALISKASNNTEISNPRSRQRRDTQRQNVSTMEPERYWNEFDDGEDFENNTFYVDEEDNPGTGNFQDNNDQGFIRFNRSLILNMYNLFQNIRNKLGIQDDLTPEPLLQNLRRTSLYTEGSSLLHSNVSTSASQNDFNQLYEFNKLEIEDSTSVYEYRHDQVVTLFYLSALAVSATTSGITFGIILALFTGHADEASLEVEDILVIIIIISLLISMLLNCASILILFSRYKLAPMWHYAMSFSMFILVTFIVCYGVIEILM